MRSAANHRKRSYRSHTKHYSGAKIMRIRAAQRPRRGILRRLWDALLGREGKETTI